MKKLAISAALILSTLIGPAQAEKKKDNWRVAKITLIGAGDVIIVAGLFDDKGFATVCGAYFVSGKSTATIQARARDVVEQLYYTIDGRALDISTTNFKGFSSEDEFRASSEQDALGCVQSHRQIAKIKDIDSFKVNSRHHGIAE